jgi:hypothetical protein
VPATPSNDNVSPDTTLSDLEASVQSPHAAEAPEAAVDDTTDVDSARKAVEDALKGAPEPLPAPIATGAINVDLDLGHDPTAAPATEAGAPGLPDYLQTPATGAPATPSPAHPVSNPAGTPPSTPPPIPGLGQ